VFIETRTAATSPAGRLPLRGWAVKPTRTIAEILSLLTLAGCAVGPDYRRPDVRFPGVDGGASSRNIDGTSSDGGGGHPSDATLDSLIARAVVRNLDLKVAIERSPGIARSAVSHSRDITRGRRRRVRDAACAGAVKG
jgi:hypothetical protein